MNITDPEAIALLQKTRSPELNSDIEGFPEDEREGRSDIQFIADEAGWILSKFEEEGWRQNEDLANARHWLRVTKYGKVFPGLLVSRQIKELQDYIDYDAKDIVNEYRRLQTLMRKLEKMGYVSEWR